MTPPLRPAYTDHDSYHALERAVQLLAQMRGIIPAPPKPAPPIQPPDLLHLLASLTLHARLFTTTTIEDIQHSAHDWLDDHDIDHILQGTRPYPHP